MSDNSQILNEDEDDLATAALRPSKFCVTAKQMLNTYFAIMNDGNPFLIEILNCFSLEGTEK